jgi:hypothetical protein
VINRRGQRLPHSLHTGRFYQLGHRPVDVISLRQHRPLWLYVSTDSDLSGTYFSIGMQRGLKVNDLVIGINASGNTTKLYRCTALTAFDTNDPRADRAVTLSAGTQISS